MNLLTTTVPHFVIPILALGLFLAFWIGMVQLMRRLARMTDTVPANAGPRLDRSRWGNGNINGAQTKGCVRVERYASGLAVRMHPVFGNGLVWLPNDETCLELDEPGRVRLAHGAHHVMLQANLAEFVSAGLTRLPGARSRVPPAVGSAPPAPPPAPPLARPRQQRRLNFSTLALWIAVLMLAFVALRRWAPQWLEPLSALFDSFR